LCRHSSPLLLHIRVSPLRRPCPSTLLFLMRRRPPTPTLFPYTTLFRSPTSRLTRNRSNATSADQPPPSDRRRPEGRCASATSRRDRKSTRLNSSHVANSYAVFCLKKKNRIRACDGLCGREVCLTPVMAV